MGTFLLYFRFERERERKMRRSMYRALRRWWWLVICTAVVIVVHIHGINFFLTHIDIALHSDYAAYMGTCPNLTDWPLPSNAVLRHPPKLALGHPDLKLPHEPMLSTSKFKRKLNADDKKYALDLYVRLSQILTGMLLIFFSVCGFETIAMMSYCFQFISSNGGGNK